MVCLFQFVKEFHHGHCHIEICCYFQILKDKIYNTGAVPILNAN